MGVKLADLAEYKAVNFDFFKNKTVAIDFSNMCYQFLSSIRSGDGNPLMDSKGNVTSHLVGINSRIPRLLAYGIRPVFIFDGKPPELKTKERENRNKRKLEAEKKLKKARKKEDSEAVIRYSKQIVRVTPEIIDSSKKLLDAFGLPYVQAPQEADAQGAYLCREGKVYCVASSDFDNLLFGSPRMVTNLTLSPKRRTTSGTYVPNELKMYELRKTLEGIGLTQEQLITLGVLVGTDYNPGGIHGIGPKKALKLVKEHKTPEKVFSSVEIDFDWEKIMDMFYNMKIEKNFDLNSKNLDSDSLKKLLIDKYEFSEERVEKLIREIEQTQKEKAQTSLSNWG
jgi:flap endonuclease-1